MPLTNRGMAEQSSYGNMALSSQSASDFLHGLLPSSCAAARNALAAFALFIIFRFVFARFCSCFSRQRHRGVRLEARQNHLHGDRPTSPPHVVDSDDEKRPLRANMTSPVSPSDEPLEPLWPSSADSAALSHTLMARPPPAPPLTPPKLSTSIFAYQDQQSSDHQPPHHSFLLQPNPDYMSASSSVAPSPAPAAESPEHAMPRRRSYTKTIPVRSATSQQHQAHHSMSSDTEASQFPTLETRSAAIDGYAPTSPLQAQPPPPAQHHGPSAHFDGNGNQQRDIELHGEILSVMDGDGSGWSRHTRVYGGGVCLACAASAEGGFYGATVRPEEMRYGLAATGQAM